ncbi:MAG: sugar transferase [Thermodesulfobacteriota bacterium]
MLKERATLVANVFRMVDLLAVFSSFLIAYFARFQHFGFVGQFFRLFNGGAYILFEGRGPYSIPQLGFQYLILLALCFMIWYISLNGFGCYSSIRLVSIREIVTKLLKAHGTASFILLAILFLLQKGEVFSRIFIILFLSILGVLLILQKIGLKLLLIKIRRNGFNFRNILIVGVGEPAQRVTRLIEDHPDIGWHILGYLNIPQAKDGVQVDPQMIVGEIGGLRKVLEEKEVDEVIFTMDPNQVNNFENHLFACEEVGVGARLITDYFNVRFAKIVSDDFFNIPSLIFSTTPLNQNHLILKRTIDVIGSGLLLLLLLPVFVIIGLAIKLESPGPVLFTQTRVGLNGRKIRFFKFRSMVRNAEHLKSSLETLNEQSGPVFKIRNDPRITRIGRALRKYSLDELPQLINVLKGDMSLVGIRPPVPSEVEKYDRWQRRRLSMRPGITCLWQVNGRNKVSFDEWMRMDLDYIDHWSLKLDLGILLKTIPAVLRGSGQ